MELWDCVEKYYTLLWEKLTRLFIRWALKRTIFSERLGATVLQCWTRYDNLRKITDPKF